MEKFAPGDTVWLSTSGSQQWRAQWVTIIERVGNRYTVQFIGGARDTFHESWLSSHPPVKPILYGDKPLEVDWDAHERFMKGLK